jgi:hypothetical protein
VAKDSVRVAGACGADAVWLAAHVSMGPTSIPIHLQGLRC